MKRDLLNRIFTILLLIGVLGTVAEHLTEISSDTVKNTIFAALVIGVPGFAFFHRSSHEGGHKMDAVVIIIAVIAAALAIYEKIKTP